MTRSIKGPQRAAVLLLGVATATSLLVSGCGAGQIAETANRRPNINGVNAQTADNTFKVRDLAVSYLSTKGYPAGGDAPLEVTLYNDSEKAITVRLSTTSARSVALAGGSAAPVAPTSTGAPSATLPATASPSESAASPSKSAASPGASTSATPGGGASASATPSETATSAAPAPAPPPVTGPATIQIPPGAYVILNRSVGSYLQLIGLNQALSLGSSIELVFEVNGERLEVTAPVAVPLAPAPLAPPVTEEVEGGHGE